jgi:hypothetical protein
VYLAPLIEELKIL